MKENVLYTLLAVLAVVVVVWFIAFLYKYAVTEIYCLRAGWADSAVTVTLEPYCIREENEYEITKPLWKVLQEETQ